jgi:hypothetical protein
MISNIVHKSAIIKCPHCGAEYLPGEIYMPSAIIGQPDEVVRDSLGKIIYEDYFTADHEPNLTESFTCEYCNKPFVIEAVVTYKTRTEAPEKDFSSPYVSLID